MADKKAAELIKECKAGRKEKKKSTWVCHVQPKILLQTVKDRYSWMFDFLTKHDIQAKHVFRLFFFVTFLPLPIFYWAGFEAVLVVLLVTSPLWLVPTLLQALWEFWLEYIRLKYIFSEKQEGGLYEIIVPKAVNKSPKAMELFLESLLLTQGESTEISKYWDGKVRPWWSLEITGIGGEVRMYLWCWKRFFDYVATQLYAQYPEVELREVSDYASQFEFDPSTTGLFGLRYSLDGEEALPIKTYVDYKLDEQPDHWETKIDPMVNMLERFALPKQGEHLWLQILFQKSDRKVGAEAQAAIKKIYDENATEYTDFHDPKKQVKGMAMLTPADRDKVDAINRARTKPAFDCVIRGIYMFPTDAIQPNNIQSLTKMFAHYAGYNKLNPDLEAFPPDYPWAKWTKPLTDGTKKSFFKAYRLRSGFHPPYKRPTITLTTEELATIFHFPSQESHVPGQQKQQARTAEPPVNLPTA